MSEPCDLVAVVDDDADLRAALVEALELEGLRTCTFERGESALAAIDREFAGIVVTDLRMPGLDGTGLFARLAAIDPDLPVIVMTGHGDIPTAVDLMSRGAYDFIPKPFSPERLMASVGRALEKRALVLENRALRRAADEGAGRGFVGTSVHARAVRQSLRTLAQANRPILVEGEPGTGKSLCAALLHRLSGRGGHALITVDCAALDEAGGAATLFGHASGAVPGVPQPRAGAIRQADRSTLVLDNIERMPDCFHRAIERLIDSGTIVPFGGDTALAVDVALVATASCDLASMVEHGQFSRSLYLRLAGTRLPIAPVRDRSEDAAALFALFLGEVVEAAAVPYPMVPPDVIARLKAGRLPGNAHEIRALAEEAALSARSPAPTPAADPAPGSLRGAVSRYEAEYIRAALVEARGDVEAARARLDLPRKTLYDKLARHGIVAADYRNG